jgi:hypothetical protein
MKKNYIYIIILVVLGVIVYFTVIKDQLGSYSKKDTAFAVRDTTEIGKIILSDLKGDTIVLNHKSNTWIINDQYTARPDAVSNLLRTMSQLEVKVPVAKSMHNTVIKDISGRRTKVEVYNTAGKKIKGYYVGDNSDELNGNFMLMEGSQHAFVVNIPGFEGFISTVFFTDETDWRSREVFAYSPDQIKQIDLIYSDTKDSSFSIVRTDQKFELISSKKNPQAANPEIIQYYLKQFKLLNVENFILEPYKKDSLLAIQPVCILRVTDMKGESKSINIYYRPVTYRSKMQFTYEDKPIEFDLDKFYGIYNNDRDLAIVQNYVFGKLFVGPEYFYRQRPSGENTLIKGITK